MSHELHQAKLLAALVHAEQEYTPGVTYYDGHLSAVAALASELGYSTNVIKIAFLHDSVEDSHLQIEDLRRKDFSSFTVDGVAAMTYTQKDEKNGIDKIAKARSHIGAHVVKFFDALVNFEQSLREVDTVPPEISLRRMLRYREYISRLIIDLPRPDEVDAVERNYERDL